ncbi:type II toxin-antitoxin system VapC family toxin [Gordonia phthalatica]|uniref:Ribonuclease VapC n=1 Tax=Gordonia phthalatica TaxID=1136941 RepID=A0A0N9NG39_9ACTN|nr:type II toxin-antitoxin system VapC family toxin [Gordonia phthalatica]ALG86066.1 hypothetical protein ACH46_18130 [Gordonia phthalatica]
MIIDTSAAVALLRAESEAAAMIAAMGAAPRLGMSAAGVLELSIVAASAGPELVEDFLRDLRIEVITVDAEHLRWARIGHARYGRGSGSPAKLNFGDCLSYGAAKAEGRPLLYKGSDFVHTDVESAL